jgi:malonate-semialdehyde dehydrogenase (acetylating)/methylmalonate-semialdehyde dehydrogenase
MPLASRRVPDRGWLDTPPERRTEVVFRFRELLGARAADLAEIITVEHGKVLSEARGEVARGQEVLEIACDIRYGLQDGAAGDASTRVDVSAFRQPVGPVAILSPFNLPAMVPMCFLPITIAAGNTVVLKPSEKVPSAALWLARLWAEAGLPAGVFNVVHGDKVAVERLRTHPDIKAVTAAPLTASRTRSRSA